MNDVAKGGVKPEPWLTAERLGTFTDGVIAIVITILVLEVHVPKGYDFASEGIFSFLREIEHEATGYFLSFFLILVYWLQHHVMFHYVARTDRKLILLNGVFLFLLSFSPFTTAMAAEYRGVPIVDAIFGVNYFLSGVMFLLMWRYATRNAHLLHKPIDAIVLRSMDRRILVAPALSLLGIVVAFFNFYAAACIYISIPFFYLRHWVVDTSWRTEG